MIRAIKLVSVLLMFMMLFSCSSEKGKSMNFTGKTGEIKLMTIDPGHFHAALVQKTMYDQVDPVVHVFAPEGPDVMDHLNRIKGFNDRAENPTSWKEKVYTGDDFLEKMIADKPGNVMITSGNNMKKTEYIKAAVDAGINVLADKPMCINEEGFELLEQAFESAEKNNVLVYDIMTERHEITTMLQKELALIEPVFGELEKGSLENPAVTKESVHHFFKYVSGNPIKRPPWYFDTNQQGEGIVDVTCHLVDLVQWECFPEQILDYKADINVLAAKRWPTKLSKDQYKKVTRLPDFPSYLKDNVKDGLLEVYANGETNYTLKDVHVKVSVIWDYQAPEGTGDTHYSIMRGTKSNVVIKQGKEQNYKPKLYVEPASGDKKSLSDNLEKAIESLQGKYPGVGMEAVKGGWEITIPQKYHVGHEAHFGQVTEKYLQYLIDGKLPDWEVPNMLAKYYTNITALKMAQSN